MEVDAERGARLAAFLNTSTASKEHGRVFEIFGFEQKLESLDPLSRAAGNLRRAVNAHCQALIVTPIHRPDGWGWRPARDHEPGATLALEMISLLASAGTLWRMRQCQKCGNWFFAATNKKVSCGNACRKAKFKAMDPDAFRSKRAEQMRNWRRAKKKQKKKRRAGARPA